MKNLTIFSNLKNCFQPLATGLDRGTSGCLPPRIVLTENTITFDGFTTPRLWNTVPVREDGPEAWGYQIKVPAGGWYSRSGGTHWKQVESTTYVWLEYEGSTLDVIYIGQGGKPVWETSTAKAF